MKIVNQCNYEEALRDIIGIEDDGHKVQRFNDWHWRIDNYIDVWPSSKKYRKNGKILHYNRLTDIIL